MKETQARTLKELAEVVKGRVYGDPQTIIRGIAAIEDAKLGDITFAESARFWDNAEQSGASAVIAPQSVGVAGKFALAAGGELPRKAVIEVENARLAFALLLDLFAPEQYAQRGIHPSAVTGSDFRSGTNVSLGPNCVLGENVRLGDNVTIHPLVYLGDDVEIGDNTVVYPNASLLRGTVIGKNCVIHAGAVLGADGFGYLSIKGKHRKVPQIGNVALGDDVEVGANVTVDRARTGSTRIGSGTKIDNLVHIAHNCEIGEDVIIVAQVGFAGGVEVGRNTVIGGQVGVTEQVKIGERAIIGAATVVISDVAAGAFVSGFGARPHKENMKTLAASAQLPDLLKKFRAMEKRMKEMEATIAALSEEAEISETDETAL